MDAQLREVPKSSVHNVGVGASRGFGAPDPLGDFRTTWFFGKMAFDRPYPKQSGPEKAGCSLLHRIAPSDDTKCGKT
jgi:hypothetical protein